MPNGPRPSRAARGGGLGVMLPRGTRRPDEWWRAADDFRQLDEAGCAAIWVTDHLFWGVDVPEALTLAAIAVAATRRCRIGTGVLQLPLRAPAVVAKAATTLQLASGGRFVLGLGTGRHRREYVRAGADFADRGATLDRAIAEMVQLWQEDHQFYAQRPRPPSMPLWFGGGGSRVLRRVARHGQGWLPIFTPPEDLAVGVETLGSLLEQEQRGEDDVTIGAVVVATTTGHGWSRSDALEWMGELWGIEPARFDRHLVSGSAAECAAALEPYVEAGAQHVAIIPASHTPVETFLEIAAAVPAVGADRQLEDVAR